MNKIFSSVIFLVCIVATCGISFAQQSQAPQNQPRNVPLVAQKGADFFNRVSTTLNLSDEQKNQFRQILMEIAKYRKKNIQSHANDYDNFSEMFKADKIDSVALKAMANIRDSEHVKMADYTREKMIEFHDILTPDQRKSAVENLSDYFKKLMGGEDN